VGLTRPKLAAAVEEFRSCERGWRGRVTLARSSWSSFIYCSCLCRSIRAFYDVSEFESLKLIAYLYAAWIFYSWCRLEVFYSCCLSFDVTSGGDLDPDSTGETSSSGDFGWRTRVLGLLRASLVLGYTTSLRKAVVAFGSEIAEAEAVR